jgi:DNA-binding Lrp family transcriptional regulator
MTDLRRAVLAALAADGPLDIVELAERIDDHPLTVDRVCTRLRRDGAIRTIGGGRYCLTARGRERSPVR